jgi:hypothetical protein
VNRVLLLPTSLPPISTSTTNLGIAGMSILQLYGLFLFKNGRNNRSVGELEVDSRVTGSDDHKLCLAGPPL